MLYGENGCGKTRTARLMARWANLIALEIPFASNSESVGARLSNSAIVHWPSVVNGFHNGEFGATDDILNASLAVIDDIGAEHDPSGYGREQLYLVLSRREFRWNIITTNLPPGAWHDRLERRIASRLFRNADHIDLSSVPDYSTA